MQNERKKLMRFTNSNKHNVPYCESNTCLVQIKKKELMVGIFQQQPSHIKAET